MEGRKIIFYLLMVVLVAMLMIVTIKVLFRTKSDVEIATSSKEIYVNIEKNEEKNNNMNLNNSQNTIYYYFNITNNNIEENKYNQTDVIPYIKVDFNTEESADLITWKIYEMNNENDEESFWKPLTQKGEENSNFVDYYECSVMKPYDSANEENNVQHYALKINLDTAQEEYNELQENIIQNFSLILGYKEVK